MRLETLHAPLKLMHIVTAPFHLCEESSNANTAAPRAIVMTSVSGLVGGWATVLVIAYTLNEKIYLAATQYSQQFGGICTGVLGQRAGLALFSLNIIAQFFVGQGITITASRIVFAFARDGALPASKQWSHVDRRTQTPVIATWGVLWISALLGLLMFASPVAIGAVFSLGEHGRYIDIAIQPLSANTVRRDRTVHFLYLPGRVEAVVRWGRVQARFTLRALTHNTLAHLARSLESGPLVQAHQRLCLPLVAAHRPGHELPSLRRRRPKSLHHELDLSHLWRSDAAGYAVLRRVGSQVVQGTAREHSRRVWYGRPSDFTAEAGRREVRRLVGAKLLQDDSYLGFGLVGTTYYRPRSVSLFMSAYHCVRIAQCRVEAWYYG